jgi:hypothetical protein
MIPDEGTFPILCHFSCSRLTYFYFIFLKLTEYGAAAAQSKLQAEPDAVLAAQARRGNWDEGIDWWIAKCVTIRCSETFFPDP